MKNSQGNSRSACVCQSGKPFIKCCDRFLNKGAFAKTPEQLMRSRYSAFKLGGYGDYLINTWEPSQIGAMTASDLSMKVNDWQCLSIISKSQAGDTAYVEFKATFLDDSGDELVHHENSRFVRQQGRWLYIDGVNQSG